MVISSSQKFCVGRFYLDHSLPTLMIRSTPPLLHSSTPPLLHSSTPPLLRNETSEKKEPHDMKTKSVSPSALHTPRSINGVACRSLVVLLALLALIAFASSSALATQADPVDFSESGASPSTIYVYATTVTSGATIFATMGNYFIPADPTHNGGTPTGSTFICG